MKTLTIILLHVGLYALVIGYMYVGALVYHHIELDAELAEFMNQRDKQPQQIHTYSKFNRTSEFVKKLVKKSHADRKVIETVLKEFLAELKKAHLEIKGVDLPNEPPETEIKLKWNFASCFLFAYTIITSIGYGNIVPATIAGKVFTMVYALFGIPLFLVALTDLGTFINSGLRRLYLVVRKCCFKPPIEADRKHIIMEKFLEFLYVMMVFLIFIMIGATVLPLWETDLTLFTAIYYTFNSISTIGLGDSVPQNMTLLPLTLIYITLGLWMTKIRIEQIGDVFKIVHYAGRRLSNVKSLTVWLGGHRTKVGDLITAVANRTGVSDDLLRSIDWDETMNELADGKMPLKEKNVVFLQDALKPTTCPSCSRNFASDYPNNFVPYIKRLSMPFIENTRRKWKLRKLSDSFAYSSYQPKNVVPPQPTVTAESRNLFIDELMGPQRSYLPRFERRGDHSLENLMPTALCNDYETRLRLPRKTETSSAFSQTDERSSELQRSSFHNGDGDAMNNSPNVSND